MKKGQIAELESGIEVELLRSIGRKEKDGQQWSQFWEVKLDNGDTDVFLLKFKNIKEEKP